MRVVAVALAVLFGIAPRALAQTNVAIEYYHLDLVGSVRAVTNETAQVVRQYDYFPFGEGPGPSASGEDALRFAYKPRDPETGLDYFNARYYRSRLGRFTTADPGHVNGNIFDTQSWNAYAYTRNNPFRYADPTGTEYFINIFGGRAFWAERLGAYTSGGFVFDQSGDILNATGDRVGTWKYYSPFQQVLFEAARRAEPGVNAALALGTAQVAIVGAVAAVPVAAAGSESLWLGSVARFGNIVGWGTGQSGAAVTQQLARTLTKDAIKHMIRRGLTRSAVEEQLAVYQRALAQQGAKLANTQLLPRIEVLEKILKLWP
jgi:RHS repeat-associated protein